MNALEKHTLKNWWVLERNGETRVIHCTNDPLYGYGSWNLYHPRPFASYEEAAWVAWGGQEDDR